MMADRDLFRWQESRGGAEKALLRSQQILRRHLEQQMLESTQGLSIDEQQDELSRLQSEWEEEEKVNLQAKQREQEQLERKQFTPNVGLNPEEPKVHVTDFCVVYGDPSWKKPHNAPDVVGEISEALEEAGLRGHCTCRADYDEAMVAPICQAVGSARYVISILTGGEPKRKGQRSPWQNQYLWDVKMAQSVATTQMSKRIFVPVFSGVERAEEQLQKAIKGDSVLYKMCELQTLNTEDEDWMMELEDILTGNQRKILEKQASAEVKDEDESNMNPSEEEVERKRYDFCILYDEEHSKELKELVLQTTETLEGRRDRDGYSQIWHGVNSARDGKLGYTKLQQMAEHIESSDLIICLLTKSPEGELSPKMAHMIQLAFENKVKQNKREWVIPVYCYMTEEEVGKITKKGKELAFLRDVHGCFFTNADDNKDWMEKIANTLTSIPASGPLKSRYQDFVTKSCSAMSKIQKRLDVDEKWREHYIPPSFTAKEMTYGSVKSDSPVARLKTIEEVLQFCRPSKRLLIAAGAGMGKSMLSLDLTNKWRKDLPQMMDFKLVFLMPLRLMSNHTAPLERIICEDLKLMDVNAERELKRTLEYDSEGVLFLVDGYDELPPGQQQGTTINKLLAGDLAPDATVVVTTRPQRVGEITNRLRTSKHGTYVQLELEKLEDDLVKGYIVNVCVPGGSAEKKELVLDEIYKSVPPEVLRVPLLMTMTCLIWKWNQKTGVGGSAKKIYTESDVIGRMLGIYLSIQQEKLDGGVDAPSFVSPSDDNIIPDVRRLFERVTEMCYHCIKRSEFVFSLETLKSFHLDLAKDIQALGFLEVEVDSDGAVVSARCLHTLIHEYCAADYITQNKDALNDLIAKFDKQPYSIASRIGFLTNTLVFAVGIKPDVLKEIASSRFHIPVVIPPSGGHRDLDISYEARLVHECSDVVIRDEFLSALSKAPLARPVPLHQAPEVNISAYVTLMECLGMSRCLELLKAVHQEHMELRTDGGLCKLQAVSGKRTITDTLLLSCLPGLSLTGTSGLLMHYASPELLLQSERLIGIQDQNASEVQDPRLHDVKCSVQSLLLFLNHISRSRRFSQVTLDSGCRVMMDSSRPPSAIQPIEVGELWIRTTMSLATVQELLKRLDVTRLILEWCELQPPDDKDIPVNLPGVKRVVLRWVCGARHLTTVRAPSVRSIRVIGWYKDDKLSHKTLHSIFPAKTCSVEYDVSHLQVFDDPQPT